MNKVYILAPHEDWIIDRFVNEWSQDNPDITVQDPVDADVIWLMADFCWQRLPLQLLSSKKVITTIHHIVPEKFKLEQLYEFNQRDRLTTEYHVPNKHTEAFIRPLTEKPINIIPYWANQKIWRPTGTKSDLRKKYGLPEDGYLVGSFQRDTEGAGLQRGVFEPKDEKGPREFVDFVEQQSKIRDDICVLLAGWRRQFIIHELKQRQAKVRLYACGGEFSETNESVKDITYLIQGDGPLEWEFRVIRGVPVVSQSTLNELYQTLDLYPVTAKHEGGPQSLIECGLLGIPMVSRDVGMASQLLPATAIADDVSTATPAVPVVDQLMLNIGYKPYRDLIQSL